MSTNLPAAAQPDVLDRLRAVDMPAVADAEIRDLLEDARLEVAGLRGENASLRRQLLAEPPL